MPAKTLPQARILSICHATLDLLDTGSSAHALQKHMDAGYSSLERTKGMRTAPCRWPAQARALLLSQAPPRLCYAPPGPALRTTAAAPSLQPPLPVCNAQKQNPESFRTSFL
jgi:hypothetical protein